jgi:hypothetical protein
VTVTAGCAGFVSDGVATGDTVTDGVAIGTIAGGDVALGGAAARVVAPGEAATPPAVRVGDGLVVGKMTAGMRRGAALPESAEGSAKPTAANAPPARITYAAPICTASRRK